MTQPKTHPILPKLKPNYTIDNFPKAGVWDVRVRDALQQLSKSLKVDSIETDLSSIPDMWARPLLFEMALLNPGHVLYPRILGEWRGFLAMLALKEVLGLQHLTATQVRLPAIPVANAAEPSTKGGRRDFLQTLAELLPRASLAADTSWQSPHVFLFEGKPIGMTSPTTLIATAAYYLDRMTARDVPWYDGARLRDPLEVLSPTQKGLLAGWLDTLIRRLGQHQGLNANRWDQIAGLLRRFIQELGPPANCALGHSGFGIQGSSAGIFVYLDQPAEPDGMPLASHVQLLTSPGRTPAKPLLIIDRAVAEQWALPPQNVHVTGAYTLASARIQVEHAEGWRSTEFFSRKLFVVFQESAFPATAGAANKSLKMPGGTASVTPILPVNPKLLQYLTAADLSRAVRWEQLPDGLKLRLFLQLSGPEGDPKGKTVEISRLYRREDIQTLDNVPILEVWPNFCASEWKAYYTCYSTDDTTSTFEAAPWVPGAMLDSRVDLGGSRRRRYWRTETFPEAMICHAEVANESGNQMDRYDAGLLLLSQPAIVRPDSKAYTVGVDFGASSTTICAGHAEESFAVEFVNRKLSITASGTRAQAQLFDLFLPDRLSRMPLLSFFHDFGNSNQGGDLSPFLHGHAYLSEAAEFQPDTKGLAFDLKWSHEPADRRRVRAFLTQLCLQTAAELVIKGAKEASWAFSYPTAFDQQRMTGFPGICGQVVEDCARLSGLRHAEDHRMHTESEAAALYFVKHCNAATFLGSIFIDIGGSTSDISIWQADRAVWQTSVLLAGRSIFSNYLWHNPGFLATFGIPEAQRLPELKKSNGQERKIYHAFTDTLLRYNTEQIFDKLPLQAASRPVKSLQRHLALGLGGLFFYTGSLLSYLVQSGRYRQETPNIFIGGNGSRVLRWLDIDQDGRIYGLLKGLFAAGAGWDSQQPFDVRVSPNPKAEAAFGLLPSRKPHAPEKLGVLAGEACTLAAGPGASSTDGSGAQSLSWNAILTPEMFKRGLAPPARLERVNEFLVTFHKLYKGDGDDDGLDREQARLTEMRRRLGQAINARGQTNTAEIVVEPIFIMALRHYLEIVLET